MLELRGIQTNDFDGKKNVIVLRELIGAYRQRSGLVDLRRDNVLVSPQRLPYQPKCRGQEKASGSASADGGSRQKAGNELAMSWHRLVRSWPIKARAILSSALRGRERHSVISESRLSVAQ